jgi:hypothetical protein
MSLGQFTFNPKETVKNFIYLYSDQLNDQPYISVTIDSDNKIGITYDGRISTEEMVKLSQVLTFCEAALTCINTES